jgi:hypothetical protein
LTPSRQSQSRSQRLGQLTPQGLTTPNPTQTLDLSTQPPPFLSPLHTRLRLRRRRR